VTRWYRAYVGTCTDPKIAAVAYSSKTSKCKVIAMWHFVLELAADARNGGKLRMDAALFCGALDLNIEEVKSIWAHMIDRGMVTDDQVVSWKKRQYETDTIDPTNAERQRRWKAKHFGNGTVTEHKRSESDTDTESKRVPLRGKENGNSRKGLISDDWRPSTDSTQKAQKLGLTQAEIGREAEKFRNHARQNERKCVRWDSAFDNWCIRAAEYLNRSPPSEKTGGFSATPGSAEFSAWRTFARDSGKQSLVRLLDQRELEGRAFEFESQWPPGVSINVMG
jgi:hypothetical protein